MSHGIRRYIWSGSSFVIALLIACTERVPTATYRLEPPEASAKPERVDVAQGQRIFRFDRFGNEKFWTDTLRMHEVIQSIVTPRVALSVGLKVDAAALPPGTLETANLDDTQTTLALIALDAVIGLKGDVVTEPNGRLRLENVGITCALCHSAVDNSSGIQGIGNRLDGWPAVDLQVGPIIALSPALNPLQRAAYALWPAGTYDARFNQDGISDPTRIPPAYGLAEVPCETYTCEGPVSYWNAYVAVTQMHARGSFSDPRLGINIVNSPDMVTKKLPALRAYQFSLQKPAPEPGSFDPVRAELGRQVFNGDGTCARCHVGSTLTDAPVLHLAAETDMDEGYALRGTTGKYRTTPLRGLARHAPYFHDGSAATLEAVVDHYIGALGLTLSPTQKGNLVEYLKSL
ncbi:MAG: hypothetical protein ACRENU_07775 [Gemmatimonadaceae bacterium]